MKDRKTLHTSDLSDRTGGETRAEDEPLSREPAHDTGMGTDTEDAVRDEPGSSRDYSRPVGARRDDELL